MATVSSPAPPVSAPPTFRRKRPAAPRYASALEWPAWTDTVWEDVDGPETMTLDGEAVGRAAQILGLTAGEAIERLARPAAAVARKSVDLMTPAEFAAVMARADAALASYATFRAEHAPAAADPEPTAEDVEWAAAEFAAGEALTTGLVPADHKPIRVTPARSRHERGQPNITDEDVIIATGCCG